MSSVNLDALNLLCAGDILMYLASLTQNVEDLVETELVTLPEDSIIADAVKAMKDRGILP